MTEEIICSLDKYYMTKKRDDDQIFEERNMLLFEVARLQEYIKELEATIEKLKIDILFD